MSFIKNLFKRNRKKDAQQPEPQPTPLRIEGIGEAPLTPEPDEAELVAQALLEMLASDGCRVKGEKLSENLQDDEKPDELTVEYFNQLAEGMRQAQDRSMLRTMRFVSWCERELQKDLPPEGKDSLAQMETELYKRMDTVERVGGELKRRWQHCLVLTLVRRRPHGGRSEALEAPAKDER